MNRMIISTIVLVLIIGISVLGVFSLDSSCKKLSQSLDEINKAAIENDSEKASALTQKAIELWEKEEKTISLLIDHREVDEIEETIKSLPVYARQDNMEKLEEKSSIAAERVRHIRDKEKISAENVF